MTTKEECARKIAGYLTNEISHEELVKWADSALTEERFTEGEGAILLGVLSDLSASRVALFPN